MDIFLGIRDQEIRSEFEQYSHQGGALTLKATARVICLFLAVCIVVNVLSIICIHSSCPDCETFNYFTRLLICVALLALSLTMSFLFDRGIIINQRRKLTTNLIAIAAGLTCTITYFETALQSVDDKNTAFEISTLMGESITLMLTVVLLTHSINGVFLSSAVFISSIVYFPVRLSPYDIGNELVWIDNVRNFLFVLIICLLMYLKEKNFREMFIKYTQSIIEERSWRMIMDNVTEPFVLLDDKRQVKVFNRAMRLMFGTYGEYIEGVETQILKGVLSISKLKPRGETRNSLAKLKLRRDFSQMEVDQLSPKTNFI